jgi:hypothetical protein
MEIVYTLTEKVMLKRNRIRPDGFSTNLHRISTREGAKILFFPRESPFVEHSTHPKRFVNFFLLGTTLSFLNLISCAGINGFFLLLCFNHRSLLVWVGIVEQIEFFSK